MPLARIRAEEKQTASRYLPVPFAENEIGISLIPFPPRFDVRICGHATPH